MTTEALREALEYDDKHGVAKPHEARRRMYTAICVALAGEDTAVGEGYTLPVGTRVQHVVSGEVGVVIPDTYTRVKYDEWRHPVSVPTECLVRATPSATPATVGGCETCEECDGDGWTYVNAGDAAEIVDCPDCSPSTQGGDDG